jgi:hypothetical protein
MPIPALDAHGFLPPGVHEASLEEVRQEFGRFRGSDARVTLQDALERFSAEAFQTGLVAAIVVDGSFTTAVDQPNDVDLIVVLRTEIDLSVDLRPDQYNVVSARRVRSRYPFDVLYATPDAASLEPLLQFFSQVRGRQDVRKGMVRVRP